MQIRYGGGELQVGMVVVLAYVSLTEARALENRELQLKKKVPL